MPPPPIRLAILETDTPIGQTLATYGSYSGVFASLFYKAADASHIPRSRLQITGWDVVDSEGGEGKNGDVDVGEGEELFGVKRRKGYPRMGDVDAVLVTGSRMCIVFFFFWRWFLCFLVIVCCSCLGA